MCPLSGVRLSPLAARGSVSMLATDRVAELPTVSGAGVWRRIHVMVVEEVPEGELFDRVCRGWA
eukprot:8517236-Alexandrium_andersonii.AAC.1